VNRSEKLVWIVIPTWNRHDDLLACLHSLRKMTYQPVEILVVDNASEDESSASVRNLFPEVNILQLAENLGAPKASNIGFEHALAQGADYVLRLDSDTIVSPDFLEPLVEKAEEDPTIGVVSPKIYYYDPPDLIWYAGVDAHPWHFGSVNDLNNTRDSKVSHQSRVVDYVWGAAMLISREVLKKTKGFDPDFFIYYEEIDFCLRVKAFGYKIWMVSDSYIWHKIGSSANNSWTAYHWNRSKMLLYRKHAKHFFHFLYLFAYAMLYAICSPIFLGKSGNRGPFKSAIKGLFTGLRIKTS
jgi:hypothetical protein